MPAPSVAMVIAASFSAEDEWNKESGELWVMERKKMSRGKSISEDA